MALFGNKKTEEKKPEEKATKKVAAKKPASKKKAATNTTSSKKVVARDVLLRPHITEKAAQATAQNVYTFDITRDADKKDVAAAIQSVYKVKPIKVNVVKTPGKRVRLRTRRGFGQKSMTKKAYVYLKDGDRIEFSS